MQYHFIGIAGAGMSAVAKLLIEQGHLVTGSDEGFYPPISDYLSQNHIVCASPFSRNNIPPDVDYIVIGKHAKLIPEENEEVKAAFASGKKIISFPEALQALTENRERIVVAGSYGKSTCTSLMSWILEYNHIDAGYFIGALPLTPTTNAHVGTAPEFILEGDEYPSSNFDSTSKFIHYRPEHVLLTALAHDHVNVFPTHEDYLLPFSELLALVPPRGTIVACLDDETIQSRAGDFTANDIVTYGLTKDANWYATNITYGDTTSFDIVCNGEHIGAYTTLLLGKHNIQNIVGVVALLLETHKVTVEQTIDAVKTFKGIVRRLDRKSYLTRIPVYEGFGSSYDKARSAIEAINLHFPNHTLVIIFEPHTFSWRNRNTLHWYDTVFKEAGHVFMYKPPLHGTGTHDQLSHDEIIERVHRAGVSVSGFTTKEEGVVNVVATTNDSTVILILSSGGMDGLIPALISSLETEFPII
jgi:UDP-N-acetylmuramate: L-alanyl-gamma-D-glutamyl-meso-diaminopimelate ligase